MATAGALIEMATQCSGAASLDGPQHLELLPTQMRGLVALDEVIARRPDNIGHLQGGLFHRFFGSERESDRSAILGCFLDRADGDEFNVIHSDPLGLQEQVA